MPAQHMFQVGIDLQDQGLAGLIHRFTDVRRPFAGGIHAGGRQAELLRDEAEDALGHPRAVGGSVQLALLNRFLPKLVAQLKRAQLLLRGHREARVLGVVPGGDLNQGVEPPAALQRLLLAPDDVIVERADRLIGGVVDRVAFLAVRLRKTFDAVAHVDER